MGKVTEIKYIGIVVCMLAGRDEAGTHTNPNMVTQSPSHCP